LWIFSYGSGAGMVFTTSYPSDSSNSISVLSCAGMVQIVRTITGTDTRSGYNRMCGTELQKKVPGYRMRCQSRISPLAFRPQIAPHDGEQAVLIQVLVIRWFQEKLWRRTSHRIPSGRFHFPPPIPGDVTHTCSTFFIPCSKDDSIRCSPIRFCDVHEK
jgi:hypothetical protein